MLLKKNMCIRYMPKVNFEMSVTSLGALVCLMHVNIRNAPNVASNTFGVQNSHDHSIMVDSMVCWGTAFIQKDHAV